MKKHCNSQKNTFFKKMHATTFKFKLITILLFASAAFNNSFSQVTITAPSLFDSATCEFPTPYVTLDDIVITETAPGDFATTGGINKTLILTAPANFSFLVATGSVLGISADITNLSISSVTANKITITFRVATTTTLDVVTISDIQVRGINSPSGPSTLKRDAASTSVINGDVTNTVHATFTSIAKNPVILVQPFPKSICEGGFTSFSVSTYAAPTSYQWQEDQGSGFVNLVEGFPYSGVATALVNILGAPGSMTGYQYRCEITGTDNICYSTSATLTVNPPPEITADPFDTAVCEGNNASFLVETTGSSLTYSWLRSTNGGATFNPFPIVPPYSVSANSLLITTVPASFNNYQYHCLVSDGSTCGPDVQSTTPGILTVHPKPIVVTVNDTVCAPGTFNLTLPAVTTGSTPGLSYSYFTDAPATNPYLTPLTAGAGTYYIVGTTGFTCSDTTAVIETVNPKPDVVITDPTAVCFPATVDLTLPAVTASSTPGLSFTYFTNAAATISIPDSSKVAINGTYYIVGVVPATGCSDTAAVIVTINPKPNVVTNDQTVCAPATVDLTAAAITSGSTLGLNFSYFTDPGASSTYATPATAVAGTYYIVGTVPVTLCSDTTAVIITVNTKPTLVISNPQPVCAPATVDVTAGAVTAGSTPGSLSLNYYSDAAATLFYATPTIADSGTYYIVGEIVSTGCTDTAAVTVTVEPKPATSTPGLNYTYYTNATATIHIADSTAAGAGTYYIVGIKPETGCSDTAAVTVTVNSKPTVVTNDPPPICTPSTLDLTLPAVTSGSTPGLSYTYFTDAQATTHMADSSAVGVGGVYYIVGVIAGGCSDTTAVTVTVNQKPDLLTTDPAAVCFPSTADLTLPAVTAGSTPGLSLFYFSNPGPPSFYGSPDEATAGTYYILGLIPGTGCSDTTAVTVTVNPKPDVITTSPPAVCAPLTTDITLLPVTAGSTPGLDYSYYLDAAASILFTTPTAADSGTYYIVGILPLTGCSDTTAVLVNIDPKPTVVTNDPGVCFPATMDLTELSVTAGSTANLTFTYFTDAGANTSVPDETAVGAGTYYIVGETLAGCSDTTAVTVTVNPKPDVFTTDPAAVCAPVTVDLTLPAVIAGSTGSLTYTFFTDAGATTHTADSSAITADGTYYIVGTTGLGCTDTTAVTVTINPKPTVQITDPAPVCSPSIVDLTAPAVTSGSTAGLTLSYFTDAAATTHIADSTNISGSGTYYIVGVIPATGCSDTSAVSVSVDAIAIGGSVSSDAFVCSGANGDTLTLSGHSGTIQKWQYSVNGGTTWIDSSITTTKFFYSNITTTTWYRALVSEFCTSAFSIEARITVDTSPLPIGGTVTPNDTVCSGSNNDTLLLTGHSGTVTRWESSIDGGTTWVYINDSTTSLIYTNLTTTTIFHAIVQNGNCNTAVSTNDTITVNPVSNAGIINGATSGCAFVTGSTLSLSGYTGNVVNWQYSVDSGNTWSDSANTTDSYVYAGLTDTTFYRAIVKSGVCANDTTDIVNVNIYPKPVAQFTADTVCFGGTTTFTNTSTVESGFMQYHQWDFGDNSSSVLLNPTHTYTVAGANTVNLITTSNLGCLDTATAGIFVNPLPNAQIIATGPLSFCCGGSLSISGNAGLAYLWSTSATTQSIVVSNCQASGVYSLTVTDPSTLCTNSSSVSIVISALPVAFAGNDTTISLGSSYLLNGQGGTTYSWSPATGLSNPDIASPLAGPLATTTYELTVLDNNGCSDIDSLTITVIADFNVTLQNLMTANGDGYNDKWIIKNVEHYPGTEVIIVNREGQQVFYSSSYDNSWNGSNKNGKPLPDGTYYYFIKFKNSDKMFKGPLTILNE